MLTLYLISLLKAILQSSKSIYYISKKIAPAIK